MEQRHQAAKDQIQNKMGAQLFGQIYEMLSLEMENETDPR